jgi:hypothetical protein
MSMIIDADAVAVEQPSGLSRPQGFARRLASDPPCSELWGTDQATFIGNNLVNKVLNGVEIPGVKLPGLIEKIVDLNEGVIDKAAFGRVTQMIGKINLVTSILTLMMQYQAIEVGGAFDTLERTKNTTPGNKITNRIDLSIDPGKLPDQNQRAICALSMLLNAMGVSLSTPAAGPLAGASVLLQPGTNIPSRVLFDESDLSIDTDAAGGVEFDLIGVAQKKELPESSTQIDLEYGVIIEATVEPTDGNSIFTTIFVSLTGVTTGGLSLVAPALDIVKTIHWSLGEQFGPLKDWELPAFRIDQPVGDLLFTGVVCGFDQPFTLESAPPAPGAITFSPTGLSGGTYAGSGQVASTQGVIEWNGSYTVNGAGTENPTIFMEEGTTMMTNIPVIGQAPLPGFWSGGVTFTLIPDPEGCAE